MRKLTFYLKFLMGLLLFAFIAPPAAQAETLDVCNGTVTNAKVPFDVENLDSEQGYASQFIYPSNTLTGLSVGNNYFLCKYEYS